MSIGNVPDDWGSGYGQCGECGRGYHASGSTECACSPCELCDDLHPPHEMTHDTCTHCVDSGAWAWKGTDILTHMEKLWTAIEEGSSHSGDVLHDIELLQSELSSLHKKLSAGFKG